MALTERWVSQSGAGLGDGSSAANAWSIANALTNAAAGDIVNVLEDITLSANFAPSGAGSGTQPIVWRSDPTTYPTGMATIDGGASYNVALTQPNHVFENIKLTHSQAYPARVVNLGTGSASTLFIDAVVICTGTGYALYEQGTNLRFGCINSLFETTGETAIESNSAPSLLRQCSVYAGGTSSTGTAVITMARAADVQGCDIIAGAGQTGITVTADAYSFVANNFHGCDSCIEIGSVYGPIPVADNVAYGTGSAGYFLKVTGDASLVLAVNNAAGNFGTANFNGLGDNPARGTVSLTGDPFTDSANKVLSLNNTAGAGAACRGARNDPPAFS